MGETGRQAPVRDPPEYHGRPSSLPSYRARTFGSSDKSRMITSANARRSAELVLVTAITSTPASLADRIPSGEFSTTTEWSGRTPSFRRAARYGSGSGLVFTISSAVTTQSSNGRMGPRFLRAFCRLLAVTRAVRIPRRRIARTTGSAPEYRGIVPNDAKTR